MKKTLFALTLALFMAPNLAFALYDPDNPTPVSDDPNLMRITAVPTLTNSPIGEVVYQDPKTKEETRVYSPYSALKTMEKYALGISRATYESLEKKIPEHLDGQILLNVDDMGKAYIADAASNQLIYLGKPAEAFELMKKHFNQDELISTQSEIPENCTSWFDGCNTCFVEEGELAGCTRKFCAEEEEPKCLQSN